MNINLSEGLQCLANDRASLLNQMLRGKYSYWIGSGVSRSRFPDLEDLIFQLLCKLHEKANWSDPACPYCEELSAIKRLNPGAPVNIAEDPRTWAKTERKAFLSNLASKYAEVLDGAIYVDPPLTIWWDILELHKLYGDSTIEPDAEHRFLALLIEEGIVKNLITTNWDPLIETAHEECSSRPAPLKIIAANEDINGQNDFVAAKVLKIHGCARKVSRDEDVYKQYMVATSTHLQEWLNKPAIEPILDELRTLLRNGPAIFIGMSVQDLNLQILGNSAFTRLLGTFDADSPRIAFTEKHMGNSQKRILQAAYGEEYKTKHAAIDAEATVPMYAKPLLGSLYILTLLVKARCFLDVATDEIRPDHKTLALDVLEEVQDYLCSTYDPVAVPDDRWRQIAAEIPRGISRFVSLFRGRNVPATDKHYETLYPRNLAELQNDQNIVDHEYHWLLIALAVIFRGQTQGLWRIEGAAGRGGEHGQFTIDHHAEKLKIFVLHKPRGRALLAKERCFDLDDHKIVLVYPGAQRPERAPRRVLRRILPRTARVVDEPYELYFKDCLDDSSSSDELISIIEAELEVARAS